MFFSAVSFQPTNQGLYSLHARNDVAALFVRVGDHQIMFIHFIHRKVAQTVK